MRRGDLSSDPGGLPLTGERTVPDVPEENYWFRRHETAYRFAAGRVRGTILDAGAGEGYGAASLGAVALELDERAAAHAGSRYPGLGVVRGDLCRMPIAPRSLDGIVSLQVLEHLWCPRDFVDRARETLRPGGSLVVSTPNRLTFSPRGVLNPFHAHEYTGEELEALLRRAFYRVELLGVRHGVYLRSLDVLAEGSLQHLLMRTAFAQLPSKIRTGIGLVRADHFDIGPPEGSVDLIAVASESR